MVTHLREGRVLVGQPLHVAYCTNVSRGLCFLSERKAGIEALNLAACKRRLFRNTDDINLQITQ